MLNLSRILTIITLCISHGNTIDNFFLDFEYNNKFDKYNNDLISFSDNNNINNINIFNEFNNIDVSNKFCSNFDYLSNNEQGQYKLYNNYNTEGLQNKQQLCINNEPNNIQSISNNDIYLNNNEQNIYDNNLYIQNINIVESEIINNTELYQSNNNFVNNSTNKLNTSNNDKTSTKCEIQNNEQTQVLDSTKVQNFIANYNWKIQELLILGVPKKQIVNFLKELQESLYQICENQYANKDDAVCEIIIETIENIINLSGEKEKSTIEKIKKLLLLYYKNNPKFNKKIYNNIYYHILLKKNESYMKKRRDHAKMRYATNSEARNKQLTKQKPRDIEKSVKLHLCHIFYKKEYKTFTPKEKKEFKILSKPYLKLFNKTLCYDWIINKPANFKSLSEKEKECVIEKYVDRLVSNNNITDNNLKLYPLDNTNDILELKYNDNIYNDNIIELEESNIIDNMKYPDLISTFVDTNVINNLECVSNPIIKNNKKIFTVFKFGDNTLNKDILKQLIIKLANRHKRNSKKKYDNVPSEILMLKKKIVRNNSNIDNNDDIIINKGGNEKELDSKNKINGKNNAQVINKKKTKNKETANKAINKEANNKRKSKKYDL